MIVLADNDIILKLAQCDLLECLPDIVQQQWNEIFVTPVAKFQLLPKNSDKKLRKCGNEETLERLTNFLETVQILPEVQNTELLAKLGNFEGIDGGEKFLFAAATEIPNSLLITGDKRALCALIEHQQQLPTVYEALQDNVLIFESAILLSMRHYGFAIIKQKLLGSPKPDGVLRLVLKSETDEADFIDGLVSYSRNVAPLLAYKQYLPPILEQF